MVYHITHHAMQRRKHHSITPKNILENLLKEIEQKYLLSSLKDATYKISNKGITAIIKKEQEKLTMITQRGFRSLNYTLGNKEFKVKPSQSKKDRIKKSYKKQGIIYEIFRINFKNKKVPCGTISDLHHSKDTRDNKYRDRYRYKLSLHPKLYYKYYLPRDIKIETCCNNLDELFYIIEKRKDEYFLKDFKRREKNYSSNFWIATLHIVSPKLPVTPTKLPNSLQFGFSLLNITLKFLLNLAFLSSSLIFLANGSL